MAKIQVGDLLKSEDNDLYHYIVKEVRGRGWYIVKPIDKATLRVHDYCHAVRVTKYSGIKLVDED